MSSKGYENGGSEMLTSSKKKKEWGRGNLMFLMRMKGNQRGRGKGGGRGVGGG